MKPKLATRILLLLALPLCFSISGSASSLQGKVVEVLDGDHLAIMSVSQPLKVKVIGIAAPAPNQAYADLAKQHLADLVAGKYVQVHYTRLNAEGFIMGRVTAKDMDVGIQMIRDGVAWYDHTDDASLSELEKQAYSGSEQAARSEARGLWKDPAPVAPWEFRWQEAAKSNLISQSQNLVSKSARGDRNALSNDELFRSISNGRGLGAGFLNEGDAGWKTFKPSTANFSVYVPGNAKEFGSVIPTPSGVNAELNYSVGRRGQKFYLVIWAKGPNEGRTDDATSDEAAYGIGYGLQRGLDGTSNSAGISMKRLRAVRMGPYSGWQYSLSSPSTFGTVRVFSRRLGQSRQVYLMAALNGTEDDTQVQEFLGSFQIEKY